MRVALCIALAPEGSEGRATQFLMKQFDTSREASGTAPITTMEAMRGAHAAMCEKHTRARLVKVLQSLSPADLQGIVADESSMGQRIRRQAKAWLRSDSLVHWVGVQNRKGLAPTGRVLWAHCHIPADPGAAGTNPPSELLPFKPLTRRQRQWLRRWTRRHRLLRGSFKQGPALPLDTMRKKAIAIAQKSGQAPHNMPTLLFP